jgi:hypothetical protein
MHRVKYRMAEPRLSPRRTKLQIPGWSGEAQPRQTGSREQPWHCVPFSEAAQYGIEIFYPYDNELHVSTRDGRLQFEGDFGPPPDGREWPPFRPFGDAYYTYQLMLDLKVEPGFALKMEPHPRFFTDYTDTTPLAVPALLRRWWPMIYFAVFKSPPEGRTHIFRPGEPFAQFLVIPEEAEFELEPMSEEEDAERELQSRRIYASRKSLGADSEWLSTTDTVFDATYRRIHGAARKANAGCPVHEGARGEETPLAPEESQ